MARLGTTVVTTKGMRIVSAEADAGNVQRKTTKLHEQRYGVARATILTKSPGPVRLCTKHEESANDHEDANAVRFERITKRQELIRFGRESGTQTQNSGLPSVQ